MAENTNQTAQAPVAAHKETDSQKKTMALLAYIIFFIPLLTEHKDDPFVKFHTNQGVLLVIAATIGYIASFILAFISLGFCSCAPFLISVVHLVYIILGVVNANNGEMKPLPGFEKLQIIK